MNYINVIFLKLF